MKKILLLDNYDSFTYNLQHLVQKNYNGVVEVKRDYEINEYNLENYCSIIISPGPGRPETTPVAMNILSRYWNKKPILGICLGMQCINEFFGGKTIRANEAIHGKTSIFRHNNSSDIFLNVPQDIHVARYHSLVVSPNNTMKITGYTDDKIIMSIEHKSLPIFGLQFHPESFLSQYSDRIITNFINAAGLND